MSAELIGRDQELASIEGFVLRAARGSEALVLSGEPGIGKTALWQRGMVRARERGGRVLAYRAVEAEAAISFAGLSELLDGVVEAAR